MKQLIIIGARGFGREVYQIAQDSYGYGTDFIIKGFLDSKQDALDGMAGYPPILGAVEDYDIQPDDVFICALGEPKWKKIYAEKILAKGGEFISIIHHKAVICQNTTWGKGCIIDANTNISVDVQIGDFTSIMAYTTIGHDVRIGKFCHIGVFGFFGGYSQLGDGVNMHPGGHLVPHKKVGDWAIVGARSVVIKDVKPNTTVFGIPATKVKY